MEHIRRYGLVVLLFALGWLAYAPGLSSLLLYDDFPNLSALAVVALEPVFSESFWQFVLQGEAGPAGRPLSLLSFALQAQAWPGSPYAFKAVNLLIHITNTLLVMLVARQVARLLRLEQSAATFLVFVTGALWFIHPMHTGTVLFTIQRMTLLANGFLLAGIWTHLHLRLNADKQPPLRQVIWLTASLGAWGMLALLSKELAPVLVCYLLTLEYTLLSALPTTTLIRRWRMCCLWLPLLALPVLTAVYWQHFQASYVQFREFTAGERLLTEARVLWTYLGSMAVPSTANLALFQQPAISTSLWQPLSTLLAVLAWTATITLAFVLRRRHAWFSFAVFWYLGGHLIESTLLPLELQFFHRSYLAALGPVIAASYGLALLPVTLPRLPYAREGVALVIGLIFFMQTAHQSRLWQEPLRLASSWYAGHPENDVNTEFLAVQLAEQNQQAGQAAALYDQLVAANPGQHRFLLNRWLLGCRYPALPAVDPAVIEATLQAPVVPGNDLTGPLSQLIDLTANQTCTVVDSGTLRELAEKNYLAGNDENRGRLAYELGRLVWLGNATSDGRGVSDWFGEAYALTLDPGILFTHAQYQMSQAQPQAALELLTTAEGRLLEYNDISTGTRAQKLAALGAMRDAARQTLP